MDKSVISQHINLYLPPKSTALSQRESMCNLNTTSFKGNSKKKRLLVCIKAHTLWETYARHGNIPQKTRYFGIITTENPLLLISNSALCFSLKFNGSMTSCLCVFAKTCTVGGFWPKFKSTRCDSSTT